MMNIIILTTIALCLILHRHLSTFWEEGKLPYAKGFIMYVWLLNILMAVNFIWIFGFLFGSIFTLLTFFQIIFTSILWPFLVPSVIRNNRKSDLELMLGSEPSKLTQGGWTWLVIILLLLTIVNFFTSNYSGTKEIILEWANQDYKILIYCVLGIIVSGNILRIITMKILTK
jgi:hypothetical protein